MEIHKILNLPKEKVIDLTMYSKSRLFYMGESEIGIDLIRDLTANLSGHRPKSLPWGYVENRPNCLAFRVETKQVLRGAINFGLSYFLTGMAEGFDMIATEILIELRKIHKHIKIIAVIPCLGQEVKWRTCQQARYRKILEQCDKVIVLSEKYTSTCMNERNKFMILHSSVCITCYNGRPSGMGNTVRFAKQNGCKVRIINPEDYR